MADIRLPYACKLLFQVLVENVENSSWHVFFLFFRKDVGRQAGRQAVR